MQCNEVVTSTSTAASQLLQMPDALTGTVGELLKTRRRVKTKNARNHASLSNKYFRRTVIS